MRHIQVIEGRVAAMVFLLLAISFLGVESGLCDDCPTYGEWTGVAKVNVSSNVMSIHLIKRSCTLILQRGLDDIVFIKDGSFVTVTLLGGQVVEIRLGAAGGGPLPRS